MEKTSIYLKKNWDCWLLVVILIAVNYPLFSGRSTEIFAFYPGLTWHGQWWRIFTFLFAHITRFHLLIDSIPFMILYLTLEEKNPFQRIIYFLAAAAGNVLAVILFAPEINIIGIRGLSGVTYGIMTVSALELAVRPREEKSLRISGVLSLIFIIWLVSYEILKKRFPFQFLLLGSVGIPVFVCHAGGVIASTIAFSFRQILKKRLTTAC